MNVNSYLEQEILDNYANSAENIGRNAANSAENEIRNNTNGSLNRENRFFRELSEDYDEQLQQANANAQEISTQNAQNANLQQENAAISTPTTSFLEN